MSKPLAAAALLASLVSLDASAQHVHGVIDLGIVLDGDNLAVSLTAPLSDVIGFEHAPGNEEQARLAEKAALLLNDANAMFELADAAGCVVTDVDVRGPDHIRQHPASADTDSTNHDHHDESAAEEDHEDHDESAHAEVVAGYEWQCAEVSKLESLGLRFTRDFVSVEDIEIQLLTPAGAKVLSVEGRVASVSLSPP